MSEPQLLLGIDMGGTHLRTALVDFQGGVLRSERMALPDDANERAQLPADIARAHAGEVAGIGLAVAGIVADGVLTWSANLGLADIDFHTAIQRVSSVPVRVLNDARAAGLAEARIGAGRGASTVLAVTVGTGIGGAIVVDGELQMGTGNGGEIGHMVVDPHGPICTCGHHGCWERHVGGRALAEQARVLFPDSDDALDQLLSAPAGSAAAAAVDTAAQWFALGLDNLHAIVAPDVVVLGGGIMARGGVIAQRYRAAASHSRWGDQARLVDSALGDGAGVIGAALAAAAMV